MNEVLLKENEELKNKLMEKELEIIGKEEYTKAGMKEIIEQYYTANEDCISKQKIKEIVEELEENVNRIKKQYSNGGENCNTAYLENSAQVKILKQILKEVE